MSTARLNVWVTKLSDPCHIDDTRVWYVHIVDCEGKVLHWCKRDYSFIPTECGHVDIEIPPGCYSVFASWNPPQDVHPPYTPFGNQLTHIQIVRANCGDHVCVTLFSPSFHFCGTWWNSANAANTVVFEHAGVDVGIARAALDAGQRLLAQIPADPFSANLVKVLERGPAKNDR